MAMFDGLCKLDCEDDEESDGILRCSHEGTLQTLDR